MVYVRRYVVVWRSLKNCDVVGKLQYVSVLKGFSQQVVHRQRGSRERALLGNVS